MRPVLNRSAALTLLIGGLLMTGCCGPLAACRLGCGETYIDPWINHPPGHDPCDTCGSFAGESCGNCRPLYAGVKTIWGYRYESGCDSCGGCDSCLSGDPSCGLEPQWGVEAECGAEPYCGAEPTCGLETGLGHCDGCASCGGGQRQFVDSGVSAIESDPIESARIIVPGSSQIHRRAPVAQRLRSTHR